MSLFWIFFLVQLFIFLYFWLFILPGKERKPASPSKLKICFIHPDLGIGGAEKLIVNAACGLKSLGHEVKIFTSFHDHSHCFEETINGALTVEVAGNWLPLHTKGKAQLLKAWLRFIWVSLTAMRANKVTPYDVIIVDQISLTLPLLKLSGAKVFFYCHFPDLLLSKPAGLLKKLYRMPIDFLEEKTTGTAHQVAVNSKYTLGIYKKTFTSLKKDPLVLYPCVEIPTGTLALKDKVFTIVSLNRYERKKDIELALYAFHHLYQRLKEKTIQIPIKLIIAGGYSNLVKENVEYHKELVDLTVKLEISSSVSLLCSISDDQRSSILASSMVVLYTPSNEHFGIVPLEANSFGTAVIACDSGGPKESIIHGQTGFLLPPDPKQWADALFDLVTSPDKAIQLGKNGAERVRTQFTNKVFATNLEKILHDML